MANIRICNKCGKVGLDQYDFRLRYDKRWVNYYYSSYCRLCESKDYVKWVKHNPEYYKNRYKNNKEHTIQLSKNNYKSNKKHILRRHRQYYKDNKEYFKGYGKDWRRSNKDKCSIYSANYRASKLYQTPLNVNLFEIQEIYTYCEHLNSTGFIKYHVDHIIPLSKGGLHHQDNLQILEARLNLKKSNKITNKYKGFRL